MESILEKLILVTLGGIIGSYITSRLDILKAWRAYVVIRTEADRNLKLLKNTQESLVIDYSSSDNAQQKQIDEMINSFEDRIPVRVSLLAKMNPPAWSFRSWESQLPLLAQILSETQIKHFFEMQVNLEQLSSTHSKLCSLINTHGDKAREIAIELFDKWNTSSEHIQNEGNPFENIRWFFKFLSIVGLKRK
jgi:hypothetical protein